jgi:hypothetical protein
MRTLSVRCVPQGVAITDLSPGPIALSNTERSVCYPASADREMSDNLYVKPSGGGYLKKHKRGSTSSEHARDVLASSASVFFDLVCICAFARYRDRR